MNSFMIDYEKIYVDSYSEYYCKAETLIKKFLMKRKSEEMGFGKTSQKAKEYLTAKQKDKYNLLENRKLIEIYELFGTRYQEYEVNHIQNIFAKKIKIAFENIETSKLPLNYSYSKLIKEIAVIEVLKEISRLMTNNNRLLELFYDLNMFDEFEIREHRNISLENYPIYKKLNMIKYPNYYNSYSENEIFEQDKYEEIDLSNSPATEKIIFLQKLGVIDFLRTKQPFSTSINSLLFHQKIAYFIKIKHGRV